MYLHRTIEFRSSNCFSSYFILFRMLALGILLDSPGRRNSDLSTPVNKSGLLEFKRQIPSKAWRNRNSQCQAQEGTLAQTCKIEKCSFSK